MKKILLYIGIAVAAIGCTKDTNVDQTVDNAITITSNITTRVTNSQWDKLDAIGVYITSSNVDMRSNVLYTTTNGDGTFTSDSPICLPVSGTVELFSYYPYLEGVDLEAYEIKSENQIDLLSVTKSNVACTSSTVDLTFEHQLSKISLTIEAGDGVTTSDLGGLVAELSNISTSCEFNLTTNTVVDNSLGATGNLELTTVESGLSSSAIVIPQSLNGATLYFTTKKYGTFSATLTTSKFETSKEYTYAVTVKRDGVEVSRANIDTWYENTQSGTADIIDIEY